MNHPTTPFESEARCQRCGGSTADLLSFLDGELEAQAAAEVKKRLESCSACSELLDAHRRVGDLLGDADHRIEARSRAALPDFAGRVRNAISLERRKRRFAVGLGLAAAALFLILPTIVLWDRISQDRPAGGDPELATSTSTSPEAGSPEAGSSKAGSSKAGSSKAGSSKNGALASGGLPPWEDPLATPDLEAVVSDLDILEVFSETGLEPTEELVGTLLGDANEDDLWEDVLLDLLLQSEGESL